MKNSSVGGRLLPHCSAANIRQHVSLENTIFRISQFTETLTEIRPVTMGQKLMAHTQPAETTCRDSVMNMGPDEPVLILIKHCRDMKQQETRLRLVTLLLLLSCTTLFIFITGAGLRQHKNSGSSEQENAAEQSLAYSNQGNVCLSGDNPPSNFQRPRIDLVLNPASNKSDGQLLQWNINFGKSFSQEKQAIVIPKNGYYFVYLRIALNCRREDGNGNKKLYIKLQSWSDSYPKFRYPMEASDSIMCSPDGSRTFFVGQQFDLEEGDHLSVLVEAGHRLITKSSSFGAYLT